MTVTTSIIDTLLQSPEPSIRWKTRVNVLGESPESPEITALQQEIKRSDRVQALLAHRDEQGRVTSGRGVYAKWQGAHWAMATLADIGYPPGDESLIPVRDQLLEVWLSDRFYKEFEPTSKSAIYSKRGVPVINGRHRIHPSQQGNALWSILKLGLRNDRTDDLVERMLHWQWPDGGWNCDKNPDASHSSFMESILPLRALVLYARMTGDRDARAAADRAADIFLTRNLYRRRSTGEPMHKEFVLLHYPLYWHYDFLAGLKVMAESGYLDDPRCQPALDLLRSKRLPDGGWPAESRYYKVSSEVKLGAEFVDWGGTSKRRMNPWVTADALYVLGEAGD